MDPANRKPPTARTAKPPSKRALAAELKGLHQTIRGCSKCFKKGGNCPVSGTGLPQRGGLFLIGQAPGIKEPVAQKNFAWTAGRRRCSGTVIMARIAIISRPQGKH